MRYVFVLLGVWICCLGISACSAYPDLSHLNRDLRTPQLEILKEPGLYAQSRGLDNAGDYGVMLEWQISNSDVASMSDGLSLFRVHNKSRVLLKQLTEMRGAIWDMPLVQATEYRYELVARSGELVHTVQITTGRDLIVEGVTRLPQNPGSIQRIFFKPGGTLVTQGVSLDWNLEELHGAPGARLVSFLAEQAAPLGDAARSSGRVTMELRRASGELVVEWRGETGSPGHTGLASSVHGSSGPNGSPGSWRGGGLRGVDRCTNGSDGGRGGAGGQGAPGGPALDGGDTEEFLIRVLVPMPQLRIDTWMEPGRAGTGGRGGAGGPGGPGGRGGDGASVDCSNGSGGARGPDGPEGVRGPDGHPGLLRGQACIELGSEQSCSELRQRLESRI